VRRRRRARHEQQRVRPALASWVARAGVGTQTRRGGVRSRPRAAPRCSRVDLPPPACSPRAAEPRRSDATAAGADAEHATVRLHGNEADPIGSEPERDFGELRWSCVAVAPIGEEHILGNGSAEFPGMFLPAGPPGLVDVASVAGGSATRTGRSIREDVPRDPVNAVPPK